MHWVRLNMVLVGDGGIARFVPVRVNLDIEAIIYNEQNGGYTHIGGITVRESLEEIEDIISEIGGLV